MVVVTVWRRRPGAGETCGSEAGRRFFAVGRAAAPWKVVEVAPYPGDPGPQGRLFRVGSWHESKALSLEVSSDRRCYRLAS
ncbi:MAG TPA: hypothetical protein VEI03_19310 [Stellaceae bacterium]|nr:hypothetical protein [Stellaceae bacterium]